MSPSAFALLTESLISRDGWARGQFEDNGRHCLIGAARRVYLTSRAALKSSEHVRILEHAFEVFKTKLHFHAIAKGAKGAMDWNDQPARTENEVVTFLVEVQCDLVSAEKRKEAMPGPIKPEEVVEVRKKPLLVFPNGVFEVWNEMIKDAWDGRQAVIRWRDAESRLSTDFRLTRQEVLLYGYLHIVDHYRKAGWRVTLDADDPNEFAEARFFFRKKP